ncbi:hypothetical protein, partial [Magnetospirillum sp. LM-5]|uniref:hypothetical protein n=1 Tax=Magnetospirillum sp. LM-5 TaxID=2681466 RepID=UPI00156E8A1B
MIEETPAWSIARYPLVALSLLAAAPAWACGRSDKDMGYGYPAKPLIVTDMVTNESRLMWNLRGSLRAGEDGTAQWSITSLPGGPDKGIRLRVSAKR